MAATKPPAFQFYAKDFLEKTSTFSNEEVGAHLRLILHSWGEGALPLDDMRLARLVKESRVKFRKLWTTIGKKWIRVEDGWENADLELVRENQRTFTETASTRGARGAEARWRKHAASNGPSNAQALPKPMLDDGSSVFSLQSASRSPVQGTGDLPRARANPVGNHAGSLAGRHQLCPEGTSQACARGKCVPRSLFAEWRAQLDSSHEPLQSLAYIREFVGRVIASVPAGPIAEDGYDFWRGHWRAQHATTVPAKAVGGKGDQSKAAMARALDRLKGDA